MTTSIALCTYNGEKFLRGQIDSILNQTKKVDEIIVCDDGSTDSTIEILENYQKRFPHLFKIYRNEMNLRSVKNFEKAISLCGKDIIFLSDQDDEWLPEKVEKYCDYFEKHSNVSVICSNGFGIDENGKTLDVITIWDVPQLLRNANVEVDYFKILSFIENIATGAAMALRKSFVAEVMPFPVAEGFHHDEWIALVSSSQNKFEMLNERLFRYRVHSAQLVGGVFYENSEKRKRQLINHFNIFSEEKSFSTLKKQLKRLSVSYRKYQNIERTENFKNFVKTEKNEIEKMFYKTKEMMKTNYPVWSFFLFATDKLSNKRKL